MNLLGLRIQNKIVSGSIFLFRNDFTGQPPLAEKLDRLPKEDRDRIYDVIETLTRHTSQIKP